MTEAISVEKRVAVALYRLCCTAEDRTISELFSLGRSTVNKIYKEFCAAVLQNLEEAWLKMPAPADIEDHMREFHAMTGFPQGVGALDGCHFPVSPPKEHASDYHNYKGWYSMILLAMVDHRYRFRYTNVGSPGRCHDAFVYGRSTLRKLIENGRRLRAAAGYTIGTAPDTNQRFFGMPKLTAYFDSYASEQKWSEESTLDFPGVQKCRPVARTKSIQAFLCASSRGNLWKLTGSPNLLGQKSNAQ
ncbi:hypothetical protein HPB49_003344 [Dermacentor silvarum]|uniref:Uncharacterized protein n=1 Tax=Dermacentor silvarum TaxID=543639 RepID=A0ACB8C206_DERSI|nr:hypothetical protein HPB49_003344 [Dermacentor silvarum]